MSKINKKKGKNKRNAEVRVRKWTEEELKQFAYVLADEIDDFAYKLESLALKKSQQMNSFFRRLRRSLMLACVEIPTKKKRKELRITVQSTPPLPSLETDING